MTSSSPAVEWMATQLSGSARLLMLARHAPGGEGDELLSGGGVDGHAVVRVSKITYAGQTCPRGRG